MKGLSKTGITMAVVVIAAMIAGGCASAPASRALFCVPASMSMPMGAPSVQGMMCDDPDNIRVNAIGQMLEHLNRGPQPEPQNGDGGHDQPRGRTDL